MARSKLHPLERYAFSWELPVRTTDLNHANHLSAAALTGIFDEVFARFIASLNLGHPGLGADHLAPIHADAQVNYLGEGRLHDVLTIEVAVGSRFSKGFRVHYRVSHGERPIALAEIGMVCFDYARQAAAPLPPVFLEALNQLVTPS